MISTELGADGDLGVFNAQMFRIMKWFLSGPEAGARTSIYLAYAPDLEQVSGRYFEKRATGDESAGPGRGPCEEAAVGDREAIELISGEPAVSTSTHRELEPLLDNQATQLCWRKQADGSGSACAPCRDARYRRWQRPPGPPC